MFTSVKHTNYKTDRSLKTTVNAWDHWFIFVKISFTHKKIKLKFSVFLNEHLNNLNKLKEVINQEINSLVVVTWKEENHPS